MDRTERLLDLVALFLDAREPISWAELREHFPHDYMGISDDAAERKFERDKAELLELGFPLTYIQGDDERRDGYVVDRDAYYLPEVNLTKEELAVLYAAGSAALTSGAFPGRDDLSHALRKIGFFAGHALPTPRVRMELGTEQGGPQLAVHLEQLWEACAAHKWVQMSYASPKRPEPIERKVDPYGLALRRGIWTLVGYCHLRQEVRTFLVHRIRSLKANTARPRSPDFEVPEGFAFDNHVASYPWQHRFHARLDVRLRLTGELMARAAVLFPGASVAPAEDGGGVLVELPVTFLDGLLRFCLQLGPDCRVESPEDARKQVKDMAARILEKHAVREEVVA
ncbi:WYL domain-containing protein [Archangium sp.]|uniref:helix-turn-helix transcriptional regulator n=1 Tax=Archangium sp. TaxID=1872627 RepID=UPI002D4F0C59|nr:WYL domain-containing protein [Archangium sp.]HYO54010.1 WYL domain-containing protein [Archangium sp.]